MDIKKINTFLIAVYDRFFDHNCPNHAAALAYSTLLTIVPFLIVVLYILSFFPIFIGVRETLEHFVLVNFVPDSAVAVERYLHFFIDQMQQLSLVNLIALVIVSILLMMNMVHAFNIIWQIKTSFHLGLSFFIYFLVLLATPVVLGVVLLINSYLSSLEFFSNDYAFLLIKQPVIKILPYLFSWGAFAFLNWALPQVKVKWWTTLIAGFLTMILFEVAKYGFALYLIYFSGYRLLYGALAALPIFLVWLYVSWLIILLGATVCCCLNQKIRS